MKYSVWATNAPEILITKGDRQRLSQVLADHAAMRPWRSVEFLVRELLRATVVDDEAAPDNLVTMRSRIRIREDNSGTMRTVTLAYPEDSNVYEDAASVLTPLGASLLGLSEGQSISVPTPGERLVKTTVVKVIYQPEAMWRGNCYLPAPYGTG